MNFYHALIKYDPVEYPFQDGDRRLAYQPSSNEEKSDSIRNVSVMNSNLGIGCGPNKAASIFVSVVKPDSMNVSFAVDMEKTSVRGVTKYLLDYIDKHFDVTNIKMPVLTELSVKEFCSHLNMAARNNLIDSGFEIMCELGLNYLSSDEYKIREEMLEEKRLSLSKAKDKAAEILADKSLLDELDRIYSDKNVKKYFGNPVHYKVTASNRMAADDITDVLIRALCTNKRLLTKRLAKLSEITEMCYDSSDITNLVMNAQGGALVIEMSGDDGDHGNYASSYHECVDFFALMVEKYQLNTLFIFVELTDHPGFAKPLISKVQDDIDIIEIKEGCADRATIKSFVKEKCKKKSLTVSDDDIEQALPEGNAFTPGEAYSAVNSLLKDSLKNSRYQAYKKVTGVTIDLKDKHEEAYDSLMGMIGLTEVKQIVGNIIDAAKIRQLRSKKGIDSNKQSMHMIFTGNPGSAKTTVARLLARILCKEGVIESENIVECGRADLVGRYVGWTAKAVRSKFRQAKGGILFIDEAYALVDDSNSFGDEAINTIVQEMENHRDDTIVIFAGYPEKMKNFLDKNEGLRSRISFHVDFPDYSAGELCDILDLMAGKKGYELESDVKEKCRRIFEEAAKKAEFGNGRFVRTLLEQAEMAQASRVIKESNGKDIDVSLLKKLKAEDFEVNISKCTKEEKKIGFAV